MQPGSARATGEHTALPISLDRCGGWAPRTGREREGWKNKESGKKRGNGSALPHVYNH